MTLTHIIIYAVIQGLAELLPVSSSAHVIAAAKLLKTDDPSSPQFTLMLVLLHTGTMFAVILYFWRAWKRTFFHSQSEFMRFATKIVIATAITGAIGEGLKKVIEKMQSRSYTELVSWHLTEKTGSGVSEPTGTSPLSHLVPSDAPDRKLFHVGDVLIFNESKAGATLASNHFDVTRTSTLNQLTDFIQKGYDLQIVKPTGANVPMPGVSLRKDSRNPESAQIVIVGNEGVPLAYRSTTFHDQTGRSIMGFEDESKGEVEQLFKRLDIVAGALAAAGVLILIAGFYSVFSRATPRKGITTSDSMAMGAIQGLSLPFRGFSRSGATISLGLLRGISRKRAEEFSFALAVVLTPVAVGYELYRLLRHMQETSPLGLKTSDLLPGIEGMFFSFVAGLVALKILSKLLEKGQWWLFGVYCLAACCGVYWLHLHGSSI